MAKTKAEKIASIQEQIAQLENQRKRLEQQQKEQERKDGTKRLCKRIPNKKRSCTFHGMKACRVGELCRDLCHPIEAFGVALNASDHLTMRTLKASVG